MAARAPWLAHYDRGVPATLAPYPSRTLLDYLTRLRAQTRPRARALIFKGRELSYAELEALSDAFAVALAELGVAQGHRVGLLLPNCPQFLIAELAAWKLGADRRAAEPDLHRTRARRRRFANTASKRIVTLTRFYERVKRVQAQNRPRAASSPPTSKSIFRRYSGCCSRSCAKDARAINASVAAPDHRLRRLLAALSRT